MSYRLILNSFSRDIKQTLFSGDLRMMFSGFFSGDC